MAVTGAPQEPLLVGRIVGLFGVRGWVKVHSYTRPVENILEYTPWLLKRNGSWAPVQVLDGRRQGKGLVALLEGMTDRDAAAALVNCEIGIRHAQLPPLPQGEYYWWQLEGLEVWTLKGDCLGRVDHLMETGANDVIVVRGEQEHLLPHIPQVVKKVDLQAGRMDVDWEPDYLKD